MKRLLAVLVVTVACRPLLRTRDGGRTWEPASPAVA
jgi:hypothetical protein